MLEMLRLSVEILLLRMQWVAQPLTESKYRTGQLVVGTLKSVVAVAEYKGGGAVTEQIVLWSTLSECGLKSKRDRDQNENKNYSRSLSLVL